MTTLIPKFKQSSTGAQNQPISQKLSQTISAFDFMTDAEIADVKARTALVDVTTSLQAGLDAVSALGGGVLYLPSGTYKTTATLNVLASCGIVGDGSKATVFTKATADYVIKAGTGPALTYGITFRDFGILLSGPDTHGIWFSSTCGADISNIGLEGYIPSTPITYPRTNIGMYIDTSGSSGFFNTFSNVILSHIHIGWKLDASGASQTTTNTYINCTAAGDVQYGDTTSIGIDVHSLYNGSESVWLGGNLEGCATAVKFGIDTGRMTFNAMRFEANTTDIEFGLGSQSTTWVGCREIVNIVDNSGAATAGAQPPAGTHQFIGCASGGTPFANTMYKVIAEQYNNGQTALTVRTTDAVSQPWQNRIAALGTNGYISGQGVYKQGYNGIYFAASIPTSANLNKAWAKGDAIWSTDVASGGAKVNGWRCSASGTFVAPYPSGTGGFTSTVEPVIKDVVHAVNVPFIVGTKVMVSAGFATTGPYEIISILQISDVVAWLTLDTNSTGATTGIAVTCFGTVSGSGGTTDGSSNVVKDITSGYPFQVGQLVSVSAGFASTGPFRVEALARVSAGVQFLYLDAVSNSAQTGVTVTCSDPTFVSMGVIP